MTAQPPDQRTGLTGEAVRSFLWAFGSFGGNRVITFVGTLILARILVPEHFGLVAASIVVMTYFEVVLDLGVGSAVVYEQEKRISDRVHTAFTLNLALGGLLAGGGMLLAPLVAEFFQAGEHTALFRTMFLYLLIRSAWTIPDAVLRRDLAFRRRLFAELTRGGVRVAVSIPLAMAGYGAWSLVLGMLAGEIAGTAVTWVAARFWPRLRLDRTAIRSLLAYGISMLGVRFVAELADSSDYLVVGNRLGPEDLGIYTIAYRVPELVLVTVFWLYSMVAFPIYSRTRAEDSDKLGSAVLRAIGLTTLFAFPAGVGLAIVAHDAIHVLFSSQWEAAVAPLTLLALTLGLSSISVASGDVLPAIGRPRLLFLANVLVLPPTVAGTIYAAQFGLVAVALVQLIATTCFVPLLQYYVNRELSLSAWQVVAALRPAVVAATGVVMVALPVRLMLESGVLRLTTTILAGALGAAIAITVAGRSVLPQLRNLLASVRR